MTEQEKLKKLIQIELAKRDFYEYCKIMNPSFYNKKRKYLETLCNTLQEFYESKDKVLIINMPPRVGKSYTMQNFNAWILGRNVREKIITISYNTNLSTKFSKSVRNMISEEKADMNRIVYSDLFNCKIKKGSGASKMWSVTGAPEDSFLASSPGSNLTGFGASLIIIDDLIRDAFEAYNVETLNKHWTFYTDTLDSRLEPNGKIIIMFTRWSKKDLAGRMEEFCKQNNFKYRKLVIRGADENGKTFCEDILTQSDLDYRRKLVSPEIFEANYNQQPIDVKGRLYNNFKTYKQNEIYKMKNFTGGKKGGTYVTDLDRVITYVDTADTGDDYLACITAGIKGRKIYLLDVYYTKKPMEETEQKVASILKEFNVEICRIESNNGGRGFARNVARYNKENNNNFTQMTIFTQTKKKSTRIFTNRHNIEDYVYYPEHWDTKWSEFFKSMVEYQSEGKNLHDDAQDALTGIYETFEAMGYFDYFND